MKKSILSIVCTFFFLHSFSQEKQKPRFSIKVGTEYRITPIYSVDSDPSINLGRSTINFNLDKQLSGTSINYTLSYLIFKKFEIGFSHSFRYDHVYYKSGFDDLQPNTSLTATEGESINRWISDTHFFIGKYFTLRKTDLFLRGGFSMMNRGTDYLQVVSNKSEDNSYSYISIPSHFNFFAFRTSAGFVSNKFELDIGAYFIGEFKNGSIVVSDENSFFVSSQVQQNIIMPYLKLSYRIK
ncbi:MAG: hypothetical protein L3J20_03455 [Flavobacteriaceae bacterium]|nr:hypothetical protein [Flavobacteriaceae bacterium]